MNRLLPKFREIGQMLVTFSLTCLAWIFFRADSVTVALDYLKRLFIDLSFGIEYLSIERYNVEMVLIILILIVFEWFNRTHEHPFHGRWKWFKITAVILMLLTLGVYSNEQDFIYFQF